MNGSKTTKITGWVLSVLLAIFLIGPSAMGKFVEWEGKQEMMNHLGYSIPLIQKIGVVEIVLAVLFVIPQTALVGAILLTGYLGGATATHVRVGDDFLMPIIMGVVMWIALGCRMPAVFTLAIGKDPLAGGRASQPV